MEYKLLNLNDIRLTGNVVEDPELKYLPDGKAVIGFRIAHNNRYLDKKTNQWVEGTPLFIKVSLFGQSAERLGETLKKGHAVYVEGKLNARNWETKEQEKRTVIEIGASRVQSLVKTESTGTAGDQPKSESSTSGESDLPF